MSCQAGCGIQATTNGFCVRCSPIFLRMTAPSPTPLQLEKKNRCHQCSKKVGLLGFECSCKGTFCKNCRHAEQHHCSFNYKQAGKALLEKHNPLVIGDKLEKM
jgi:hypothetical protein